MSGQLIDNGVCFRKAERSSADRHEGCCQEAVPLLSASKDRSIEEREVKFPEMSGLFALH